MNREAWETFLKGEVESPPYVLTREDLEAYLEIIAQQPGQPDLPLEMWFGRSFAEAWWREFGPKTD